MSGQLDHSPAQIIQRLLVAEAVATLPTNNGSWPVYAYNEPESGNGVPENIIVVYDTSAQLDGSNMIDGQHTQHPGVQIRIRSTSEPVGHSKASQLLTVLSGVNREAIAISPNVYMVHAFALTSGIIDNGRDKPNSSRRSYTFNGTVSVTQTS